jgi:hypothetical protein
MGSTIILKEVTMTTAKAQLAVLGLSTANILVPKQGIDLRKWAVVACDQYTSEIEYWKKVNAYVGDNPSTLRLIFPEVYLHDNDKEARIAEINRTMRDYLDQGLFTEYPDSFFLVHRTCENQRERWGLLAAIDLEKYDYSPDSKSLVRATEGTILSRIPPRKEIRKNAPLELPHIMVLIDDKKETVIEPFIMQRAFLEHVYDTPLMAHGGSVEAFRIHNPNDISTIAKAFQDLADALPSDNPLLFAMGDGNHSLATAKSCWEDIKKNLTPKEQERHPARYALVELENIHQPGLVFEPIHRLLFHTTAEDFLSEVKNQAQSVTVEHIANEETLLSRINEEGAQKFGYLDKDGYQLFSLEGPSASIAAGTLQNVIDALTSKGTAEVDYVHGLDVVNEKGVLDGNIGLILPKISKDTFFETIRRDRALPRKTFSMGEAEEKRYYLEARSII